MDLLFLVILEPIKTIRCNVWYKFWVQLSVEPKFRNKKLPLNLIPTWHLIKFDWPMPPLLKVYRGQGEWGINASHLVCSRSKEELLRYCTKHREATFFYCRWITYLWKLWTIGSKEHVGPFFEGRNSRGTRHVLFFWISIKDLLTDDSPTSP